MTHYECDYHRGGLIFPQPENIIIKITPSELTYEEIYEYFDKRIILIRENITDQAESRVYADVVGKKFVPYTIEDSFLRDNNKKIEEMKSIIENENQYLKGLSNCRFLTYDELYNSDLGMIKLEDYLNTKFIFKMDNSKKYRNRKKSLI
jgi:hypothetical protein